MRQSLFHIGVVQDQRPSLLAQTVPEEATYQIAAHAGHHVIDSGPEQVIDRFTFYLRIPSAIEFKPAHSQQVSYPNPVAGDFKVPASVSK